MADGKIEIETGINTEGLDKGLKNVNTKLNSASNGSKKFADALKNVGVAFSGITVGVKASVKALNTLESAYNSQLKAELQLSATARNNPYLTETGVSRLKAYASELQKISSYGDEQIIPLMSNLVATGRTEEEVMKIMKTSIDVASSGAMSLESAVQSLNQTYTGMTGQFGRQIKELKGLTKEELARGDAVDIIAQKYDGIAESLSKQVDLSVQAKNKWGDAFETWGKSVKPFTDLMNSLSGKGADRFSKFGEGFANSINGVASSLALLNVGSDYEKQMKAVQETAKSFSKQGQSNWEKANPLRIGELQDLSKYLNDWENVYAILGQKLPPEMEKFNNYLKEEIDHRNSLYDKMEKTAQKDKEAEEREKERLKRLEEEKKAREQKAIDLKTEYDNSITQFEEELAFRKKTNEEISKQEELEQRISTMTSGIVAMVENSDGVISWGNDKVSQEVEKIIKLREELAQLTQETGESVAWNESEEYKKLEEAIADFYKELFGEEESPLSEQIQKSIDLVQQMAETYKDDESAYADYMAKLVELNKLKNKAIEEEDKQAKKQTEENVREMISNINSYFQQFSKITSQLTDLMTKNSENTTQSELAEISDQYDKGLIDYETYCNKKIEIDKKSALEEYKINMFSWTSSLFSATSSIAEGVAKALAGVYPMNLINASLVGSAGALQIASIVANKPQKPAFTTGGIVGGGSYTGDLINARVNSGEMILNQSQQSQLWRMANGKSLGGGVGINMPVTIENNAGANVSAQMTQKGLKVLIDQSVNTSFKEGKYTQSMQFAETQSQGVRIL